MRKQEFLSKLKRKISRIPKNELNERLNFYSVELCRTGGALSSVQAGLST